MEYQLRQIGIEYSMDNLRKRLEQTSPNQIIELIKGPGMVKHDLSRLEKDITAYAHVVDHVTAFHSRLSEQSPSSNREQQVNSILAEIVESTFDEDTSEINVAKARLNALESYLDLCRLNDRYENQETPIHFDPICELLEQSQFKVPNPHKFQPLVRAGEKYLALLEWDENPPMEPLENALDDAIQNPTPENIKGAHQKAKQLSLLKERATTIREFCETIDGSFVDVDTNELLEEADAAIKQGDPTQIEGVVTKIENISKSTWEYQDLFKYNWKGFEQLVAQYYKTQGFSTKLTPRGADRGIDVIVENENQRLAIQVKHNKPGNRVSRPTVQKTASLMASNDATHVAILTSASFTEPAINEANQYGGRMQLIDGSNFTRLLTESPLQPP